MAAESTFEDILSNSDVGKPQNWPKVDESVRHAWEAEQLQLKSKLSTVDSNLHLPLRFIGGVDLSFSLEDENVACACVVVLSHPDLKVVYSKCELVLLDLPYIPGFLGFREVPALVPMIDELRRSRPDIFPDLFLVDGNGILHPQGFGFASHLGVVGDVATVGIAKKMFSVDGLSKQRALELCDQHLHAAGDTVELRGDSGTVWGVGFRSTKQSSNPVFISVGHRVSLDTAVAIVRTCVKHRVAEPVREADLRGRAFLRDLKLGTIAPPEFLVKLRAERARDVSAVSTQNRLQPSDEINDDDENSV